MTSQTGLLEKYLTEKGEDPYNLFICESSD